MKLIPAIDLMKGQVVRLRQGDPSQSTYYTEWGSPTDVIERWIELGADTIQVIDLDAATGRGSNISCISDFLSSYPVSLQVGGGIRDSKYASYLLDYENCRIIVGSMAVTNLECLICLKNIYGPDRIIISLDYLDNAVRIRGWQTETSLNVLQAINLFSQEEFERFLVTAIERDGTLQGPDIDVFRNLSTSTSAKILAAGGVSCLSDLKALADSSVYAVIIGRALYERSLSLEEALQFVEVMS
ncbi:MAG: 1-(5-phosphoribosyl)-5-[(5-phosphoribosylamino)methylideneamino] imidazole-4-carboxamide isomerase [Candidatus Thorarchaeota archaeon]|nr:MAG: 1-(5-phosphoribosyl)-5-[(5-phosphoribosylamino)methylideneamino] imidazole-4-carboxamide isomerase [Candidatus Thorarchaeota archaeon]